MKMVRANLWRTENRHVYGNLFPYAGPKCNEFSMQKTPALM